MYSNDSLRAEIQRAYRTLIYVYAIQQDTQSFVMIEFYSSHMFDMFRTSSVHHQERFVQAVCADLVCGNTRTTRHVQPLRSCSKN